MGGVGGVCSGMERGIRGLQDVRMGHSGVFAGQGHVLWDGVATRLGFGWWVIETKREASEKNTSETKASEVKASETKCACGAEGRGWGEGFLRLVWSRNWRYERIREGRMLLSWRRSLRGLYIMYVAFAKYFNAQPNGCANYTAILF